MTKGTRIRNKDETIKTLKMLKRKYTLAKASSILKPNVTILRCVNLEQDLKSS